MTKARLDDEILEAMVSDDGFVNCLSMCVNNGEMVRAFDRLKGTALSKIGAGDLAAKIDEATGRNEHDIAEFIKFCYHDVWKRFLVIHSKVFDRERP